MSGFSQDGRLIEELAQHGYKIVKWIAEGGYSCVFEVSSERYKNNAFVAKVIKTKIKDEIAEGSYYNEIDSLIHIIHPNILNIYDYFQSENYFVFILELCSGGTVRDKIVDSVGIPGNILFHYVNDVAKAIKLHIMILSPKISCWEREIE